MLAIQVLVLSNKEVLKHLQVHCKGKFTCAPSMSCGFSATGRASVMGSKGEGGIRPKQRVEVERRKKSHDSRFTLGGGLE